MKKIILLSLIILSLVFFISCNNGEVHTKHIEKFATVINRMSNAEFYEIVNDEDQIFSFEGYLIYFTTKQTTETCKSELILETSDGVQETITTIDKKIHALYWVDKKTIAIGVFRHNELGYTPEIFDYYYFDIVSQTLSMDSSEINGESIWHYGAHYVIRQAQAAEYPEQKDVFLMKDGKFISLVQKVYPFLFSNESLYYVAANQQVQCLSLIDFEIIPLDFCNGKGTPVSVSAKKIVQWDGQQINVSDLLTQETQCIEQPLWGTAIQITSNGLYYFSSEFNLCYTNFKERTTKIVKLDIGKYLCSAFQVVENKMYIRLMKVNEKEYESYVTCKLLNADL